MSKQAVVIEHHAVETLGGNFTAILGDAGFAMTTVPVFAGAPDFVEFDAPRHHRNRPYHRAGRPDVGQ